MISKVTTLTGGGRDMIVRGVCGERITFTRFEAGNGMMPDGTQESDMSEMLNPLVSFKIVAIDADFSQGFAKLTARFDSSMVHDAFRWTELGVWARGEQRTVFNGDGETKVFNLADKPEAVNVVLIGGEYAQISSYNAVTGDVTLASAPVAGIGNVAIYHTSADEILYAYTNCGDEGGVINGATTDLFVEQVVNLIVAIGPAEQVTAIVGENALYASRDSFNQHVYNKQNPHAVTAQQVGLGNVENERPGNLHPIFDETSGAVEYQSGEPLGNILSKIKRFMTSTLNHISNSNNPHKVTVKQIKAAPEEHYHKASDMTSGVLSVERGGTGVQTLEQLKTIAGVAPVTGVYIGDGTDKRKVDIGFTPSILILSGDYDIVHGVALPGHNILQNGHYSWDSDEKWGEYTLCMITNDGFFVGGGVGSSYGTNMNANRNGALYKYIAYR